MRLLPPPHLPLIMLLGLIPLAGCGGGNPEGASPTPPVRKGPATDPDIIEGDLRVEPTSLVVTGVSQCSTPTRRSVTLHNDGETEEIVEKVITSCGCARVELPEGTAIAPGGSLEVPILFEAWGGFRRKTHEVRFILSDARLGPRLTLDVDVISPLRTIPSACQEGLHVDGRIRITADAERSFTVLGVSPELPWTSGEAMPFEQVVVIDWAAL